MMDEHEWEERVRRFASREYARAENIDKQQWAHGEFLAKRAVELDGFAEAVDERAQAVLLREQDVTKREQRIARHEAQRDAWGRTVAAMLAVSLMCLACSALIIYTLTTR